MGDSSKIFSVYTDINIDRGLDSSGGYKINVGKFTLDIGASSSDYYITGSWTDNDIENSYGIRVDRLRGQVGFEGAVTTYTGPAASKESIFVSANGLCLVYVVVYAIAGQYGLAPAYA